MNGSNEIKCSYCSRYDRKENMHFVVSGGGTKHICTYCFKVFFPNKKPEGKNERP